MFYVWETVALDQHPQIWPTPAEFSSNPNQTQLSIIRVFKMIRKSQVGKFDQSWR